jgi:hypothetical protein
MAEGNSAIHAARTLYFRDFGLERVFELFVVFNAFCNRVRYL